MRNSFSYERFDTLNWHGTRNWPIQKLFRGPSEEIVILYDKEDTFSSLWVSFENPLCMFSQT